MSAVTQNSYIGNGSTTNYSFTFPYLKSTDVEVQVDATVTTAWQFANATTVQFNTAPANGAKIKILRQTNVDSLPATFYAGSAIKSEDINDNYTQKLYKTQEIGDRFFSNTGGTMTGDLTLGEDVTLTFEGATDDAHETTLTVVDPTADRIITFPDTTGTVVTTGDTDTVTASMLANDCIDNANKIANDVINSEHYVAGSIDLEHMSANSVDSNQYVDGSIDHVHLSNDCIDGDNIQDDVINSEHYVALSIDTEHIANENVTTAKLAADAVTSAKLADNAVVTANITDANVTHVKLANDAVDGDNIADNSINSEHYVDGSIDTAHIAADQITNALIADNQIDSEHYVDGSIDHVHLSNDCVDADNIQDDAVGAEHIQANAVTDSEIATGTLDNRYFTETELTNGALDGRYFTETESDARYFNISTGDTIKDGDTFPDNDTTIATTAAINDRIIDLVDDVGGFVPIANELSFPNANPDVNNGAGTLVSIKALSQNLTSNGSGQISISNGTVGNSTVTITGAANSTTYAATFGMIVETTTTLNTYTFHRLVPKATEVSTVSGSISNVNTVAGAISNVNSVASNATNINTVAGINANVTTVAGISSNVTTVANNNSNVTAVADNASNINSVASNSSNINSAVSNASNINSAVSNASNINSAVSNASNINTVAGSISNVNTAATNIASINTTASNIADVNNFTDRYQVASSNPSTDGGGNALAEGDLYFNTTSDELKVYNGGAWQGGVTATGNFAVTTGNTFSGTNNHNDNVKSIYGTGSDGLEIYHSGSHSFIDETGTGNLYIRNGTKNSIWCETDGAVKLYYNDSPKVSTLNTGVNISGNITVTGNVDGRDVAADGTKLDGIETAATADQTASEIVALVADQTIAPSSIDMEDSEMIKLGTGDDLMLYHNGSDSYVQDNGTGKLVLSTNGSRIDFYDNANSASLAKFITGGAVELYHSGTKRLETGQYGAIVTGTLAADSVDMGDNDKILLGDGDDLEIYHSGSGSFIDNTGTGVFYIRGNGGNSLRVRANPSEESIICNPNAAVELYHDNIKKLATNSEGINVYGSEGGNSVIQLSADEGDDNNDKYRLIAGDGTSFYLQNYASGSWESNIKATGNGAVELYYDNSKKFETASFGASVTGEFRAGSSTNGISHFNYQDAGNNYITQGDSSQTFFRNATGTVRTQIQTDGHWRWKDGIKAEFGDDDDLQIYHNGSTSYITDNGTGSLIINSVDGNIELRVNNTESAIQCIENGAVKLYYDNGQIFETMADGAQITGTSGSTKLSLLANNDQNVNLNMSCDNADDNGDSWRLQVVASNQRFNIMNNLTGTQAAKFSVDTNGDATVHAGNLKIGTSGKGIDFSATADGGNGTGRAEVLDDYEEGSWSFGLTGGGGNANYATAARYTKIGRMVHLSWSRNVSRGNVGNNGDMIVNTSSFSLPFAPIAGTRVAYNFPHRNQNWAGEVDGKGLVFELYNSTLHLGIAGDSNSYNSPIQQNATIASSAATSIPMSLSLTYYTDS